MRRVFGILVALLAVALTVGWGIILVQTVTGDFVGGEVQIVWTITAVSGAITFVVWVGAFALLSAEENWRRAFGFLIGAMLLAFIVGLGIGFAGESDTTEPLPLEMFLVVADYTVDEGTGECAGSGELSGVVEGSRVSVIDNVSGDEVDSIVLAAGREITRAADPAFLFTSDQDALCLFIDGLEVDHFDLFLFHESDPNVAVGETRSEQRVVFLYGP